MEDEKLVEFDINTIELVKFHQDIYGVRVNGKVLNTRDPMLRILIDNDQTLEIAANGCLPQAQAQQLFEAAKAKKMRQDEVANEPTVVRTHPKTEE